ncbi:MAG: hypothetical protein AAFN93_29880, partial [Bacteroidota bacterium]
NRIHLVLKATFCVLTKGDLTQMDSICQRGTTIITSFSQAMPGLTPGWESRWSAFLHGVVHFFPVSSHGEMVDDVFINLSFRERSWNRTNNHGASNRCSTFGACLTIGRLSFHSVVIARRHDEAIQKIEVNRIR